MVDKQTIIHKHRVDGTSQRGISREMGISRDVVRKVLSEYDTAMNCSEPDAALESLLTTAPRYDNSSRRPRVVTGEISDLIDECLEKNARQRAMGLRKQCMRSIDIHELLIERGYTVSYPSVCKYVASASRRQGEVKAKEAFIRGHHPAGESCEFDWGEVKIHLNGKLERLYMATFTLSHSNGRWAWLFRHQNTLSFLESHRNFFRHIRGVPHVMVYDNMRVAVKEFTGADKKPTESLLRLSSFYRFHYRFCNARAGWEKGHVERSVEVIRRKAFCVKHRFDTLSDAQAHLLAVCEKINTRAGSVATTEKARAIANDLAALSPCIYDMGCFEQLQYKVDKWSTICMKGSHYSVPDTLVGKSVDVRVYSDRIAIYDGTTKVASHERIHHAGKWSVNLEHYLTTLLRKPGAVSSSVALKQMPEKIRSMFHAHFRECPKEFILLLQYAKDNGFNHDEIVRAAEALRSRGMRSLSADRLKVMLHHGKENDAQAQEGIPNPGGKTRDQHSQIESGATKTLIDISRIMNARTNTNVVS
jgi:transposase